jgi:Flp pilus assembly protein TadD
LNAGAQTPPPQQQLPPDEDAKPVAQKKTAAAADSDLPPDEDAVTAKTEYTFNPVKSKKAAAAGDFYLHKGNFKAAAERYREATGWNEGNTDAWMKLGEAEEKRGQKKAAKSAYEKYLQLAGNTKSAMEIKKRLEKL